MPYDGAIIFCDLIGKLDVSALPPKADVCDALAHICFGPKKGHETLLL